MTTPAFIQNLRTDCDSLLNWTASQGNQPTRSTLELSPIPLKKIILFGDSLIELGNDPRSGFPFSAALGHVFRRRADVLVRAASGYTSELLVQEPVQRLSKELDLLRSESSDKESTVLAVVLCIGTNDSVLPGNMHHVPVEKYTKNLKKIIEIISKHSTNPHSSRHTNVKNSQNNTQKLLFFIVTPPACSLTLINSPNSRLSASGRARSNKAVEQYVDAVYKVFDEIKLQTDFPVDYKLVDMYKAMQDLADGIEDGESKESDARKKKIPIESFLSDGVHYNGDGYRLLFREIFTIFADLEAKNKVSCPLTLPHFSEMFKKF